MNISIFASLWCQNLWDELIIKNEVKILEQIYKWEDISFKIFSYDVKNPFFKQDNIKYLEYFPIWIKDKKNLYRNIKNFFSFLNTVIWSDFIVVWWGWIIYDSEVQSNKNPLDSWIFRNNFFRFFWKKVIFYAIGINITYTENLAKLKKIFAWAYKIYVRDNYSYETLSKLWITSEIIDDPVFFDNNNSLEIINWKPNLKSEFKNLLLKKVDSHNFSLKDLENINFQNKKVWLTFRAWYIGKSHNEKIEILMIKEIINFLLIRNAKVCFLPHSIHNTDTKSNDLEFYKKIVLWTPLEDKVSIVETIDEVYEIYKQKKIDICLSMRLHSMILSQVYDIPFVAFSYSKKTDEMLKKIK